MKRAILVAMMVMVAGCQPLPPEPDLWVDGIGVKTDGMPWTPETQARFLEVIDAATSYGGGSRNDIKGWVIVFHQHANFVPCFDGGNCTGTMYDSGWIDLVGDMAHPEATSLAHEVLHVLIDDPCHHDPRWLDFAPVQNQMDESNLGFYKGNACVWWWSAPTC